MKIEYKVIALAVLFFALVCVGDALLDYLVFHERTFWDSLIYDIPPHAAYHRSLITLALLCFGLIAARVLAKRRMAEEALKNSEEKYRTIFENSPVGIFHYDSQGVVTACNERLARIIGSSKDRLVGFNMAASLTGERVRAEVEKALSGAAGRYEGDYTSVTGGRRTVLRADFVPVVGKEGQVVGGVGIVEDITDRKRAEEELRSSKETVEALLNATTDSAFLIDAEGRFLILNQPASKRFQRRVDELVGNVVYDFLPANLAADRRARVDQVIRTRRPVRFQDDRDGMTILHTIHPVFGSGGNVERVSVSARDVTEQRKAQELLVRAERFKAVSDMAGGVAHNFNNLLQIVIGRAEQALSKLDAGEIGQARNGLDQVLQTSKLGAQTVDRLQDFARHTPEDMNLAGVVFDLSEVALQAIELTEPWWKTAAEKKGIRIALDHDLLSGCLTMGRPNEISEVIVNLIKNAVEALPEGGEVEIRTSRQGRFIVLQVRDSGMGIAEENLGRIFEPFWSTKGSEGTGLGLASTYGIVLRHGGFISVESLPTAGTAFTVELPFVGESAPEQDLPEFSAADEELHVLVVDDMEPVLTVLGDALNDCCGSVSTALSGGQGLEIFNRGDIDLVICDLAMPGMNGWELGKAIRQRCKEMGIPKTPFVLLTGWGGKLLEHENIVEAGVDAVVQKPVDLRELLRVIGRVAPKKLRPACEIE